MNVPPSDLMFAEKAGNNVGLSVNAPPRRVLRMGGKRHSQALDRALL